MLIVRCSASLLGCQLITMKHLLFFPFGDYEPKRPKYLMNLPSSIGDTRIRGLWSDSDLWDHLFGYFSEWEKGRGDKMMLRR